MKAQYTLGPWRIGRQNRHDAWIHNDLGQTVCYVHNATGYRPDCSDDPNATLIAAAPDLLVACELIREAADDLRLSHPSPQFAAAIALVDAAIAKARGDE
jgi:hypothetical protein